MNSWKEGVAKKLSHLLSDRPSSPPLRDVHSSRSFCPLMPQELPIAEDGVSSPKRSTFSSVFLSKFPASCSAAARAIPSSPQGPGVSPPRSHSKSWKSSSFGFKVTLMPFKNAANGKPKSNNNFAGELTENSDNVTERSVNAPKAMQGLTSSNDSADCIPYLVDKSEFVSADLSSISVSAEFLPYLMDESTFLSANLFEFLHACLPNIVKGCQWMLLYSTMKHGISLRTLIRKSAILAGPCLLIVGDMQGAIFGGLLDSPLKPTFKRKYQGTNQTFVFTTKYGEPRLFRATGVNRYYYLCLNDIIAFGGGGNFALSLEEDLLHGTSGPSETFGNLCLAHTEEFELKDVELWGFTHSSRYLD